MIARRRWPLPLAVMASALALSSAARAQETFWSPAVAGELRPQYTVTVLEQVRHKITVEVDGEHAARTVALLEARRTSGSPNPLWKPKPAAVLAHMRDPNDFAVIDVEPKPSRSSPEPHRAPSS